MRLLFAPLILILAPLLHAQFADREHPRLWMNNAREAEMRQILQQDPLAAKLHQSILSEADAILDRRQPEHIIHDGRRLLRESRLALKQIMTTAWAWRFTGNDRYLKRAAADLKAVCDMKDWNPSHFLDTAEMAVAVAIGYDWLHAGLTAEQREMCERAIVEKALKPARHLYDTDVWWSDGRNNWAQVCGGGIAIAAIAIQGKDENLSQGLIRDGLKLADKCNRFYAPDGIYPEGPGYWHYGTNYHVKLLEACRALGHPAPIPPQLEKSGASMIHIHGPTRLPFNFADGQARPAGKSPAQAWIASYFKNASQSQSVRNIISKGVEARAELSKPQLKSLRPRSPLTLLWLPTTQEKQPPPPLNAVFNGEQSTAVFRSSWDEDAAWLAIKGGTPHGGHGHMDVGSFCYDAHGTRWIHDLGGDNYNMPGYFHEERFTYYRLQNRSHNTLEIDGGLQDAECKPCLITASNIGHQPFARFDLSAAYAQQAKQVTRTANFDPGNGNARLRDTIVKPSGEVIWRVITDAKCQIENDHVILRKQGETIRLKRHSKEGQWRISDAKPALDIENDNKDYRVVSLHVPAQDKLTIEVEICP